MCTLDTDCLERIGECADVRTRGALHCLCTWHRRGRVSPCDDAFCDFEWSADGARIVACGLLFVDRADDVRHVREFFVTTPATAPSWSGMRVAHFDSELSLLRHVARVLDVCARSVFTFGRFVPREVNARRSGTLPDASSRKDLLEHVKTTYPNSSWCVKNIARGLNIVDVHVDELHFPFATLSTLFLEEIRFYVTQIVRSYAAATDTLREMQEACTCETDRTLVAYLLRRHRRRVAGHIFAPSVS